MTPLLVTLLIASAAAAATYGVLSLLQRRSEDVIGDPQDGADGQVGTPARLVGGSAALAALAVAGITLAVLARAVEREHSSACAGTRRSSGGQRRALGPSGTAILRAITHLGDTVVVLGLAGVFVVALLLHGRRRLALFTAAVVLGQWALANLIKEFVGRARPELDPLAAFSGFSFPSGHATAAAATYLALALVVAALRPSWDARIAIASGVGVAVAVAASRAMLGVHWFSDVLGGLVLGWAWCLVCAWLFRVVRHKGSQDAASSVSA